MTIMERLGSQAMTSIPQMHVQTAISFEPSQVLILLYQL